MNPDDATPDPSMAMNESQIAAIVSLVHEKGRNRKRHFMEEFNECDFLCGAMTAFFACGQPHHIPASWIFAPLCGQTIFDLGTPLETLIRQRRRRSDAADVLLNACRSALDALRGDSDGDALRDVLTDAIALATGDDS